MKYIGETPGKSNKSLHKHKRYFTKQQTQCNESDDIFNLKFAILVKTENNLVERICLASYNISGFLEDILLFQCETPKNKNDKNRFNEIS